MTTEQTRIAGLLEDAILRTEVPGVIISPTIFGGLSAFAVQVSIPDRFGRLKTVTGRYHFVKPSEASCVGSIVRQLYDGVALAFESFAKQGFTFDGHIPLGVFSSD